MFEQNNSLNCNYKLEMYGLDENFTLTLGIKISTTYTEKENKKEEPPIDMYKGVGGTGTFRPNSLPRTTVVQTMYMYTTLT